MDQRNHPRKNSSLNDCLDNSDNYIPHIFALITKAAESFKSPTKRVRIKLTATDLKEAENLWTRSVKTSSFSKEIAFRLSKDHSSTPPTYVTKFGLYLDEEMIKCQRRLNNASLPVNTRNPVLMPAKHEFTHLLIKQSHKSVKHNGIRDTLTTLWEW